VDEEGRPGGAETDIRSLFTWSRWAFSILVVAGILWICLGAFRIYEGLKWIELDTVTGSTQSDSDLAWGVSFMVAASVAFILARWVQQDIVTIFGTRRFQVPREKLLIYSMLALPFGFVVPGMLLIFVNVKLSYPEFLPSHAEAYPEAMPGFMMTPTEGLEGDVEEGAEEDLEEDLVPEDAPEELAPLEFESMPVPQPIPAALPTGEAPPEQVAAAAPAAAAPPMAYYEEITDEEIPEEAIPEVVPQVVAPPPMVAIVEEVVEEEPGAPTEDLPEAVPIAVDEAEVTAIVEDVPPEGEFELIEGEPPEEGEEPKTIEGAHEELLGKLLGK
jgi:hypothetical protein